MGQINLFDATEDVVGRVRCPLWWGLFERFLCRVFL
jgi:hypothetical protein